MKFRLYPSRSRLRREGERMFNAFERIVAKRGGAEIREVRTYFEIYAKTCEKKLLAQR